MLSPARRMLWKDGHELALIPRYFDLLLLLVDQRDRAVTRQEIFDRVWADVVVSDGALTQAIRTIRRVLDDDPREVTFIRTVSRHGYQFVWAPVGEEADEGDLGASRRSPRRAGRARRVGAGECERRSVRSSPRSPAHRRPSLRGDRGRAL